MQFRFRFFGARSFSIDALDITEVTLTSKRYTPPATAQSADTAYLGPFATVHFRTAQNKVMASITNLTAHDYGCTTVSIDRTGQGAQPFDGSQAKDDLADKTFRVVPTTNDTNGIYIIRLFYEMPEIVGWENATGGDRNSLNLLKSPDAISNLVTNNARFGRNPSPGQFMGRDFKIEAQFESGFSGFGAGAESAPGLPIELLEFNASRVGEDVLLDWTTATELENSHFNIQRSLDGEEFDNIGRVEGNGTSFRSHEYQFLDQEARTDEWLYYRLEQVDSDGTSTLTDVRAVQGVSADQQRELFDAQPNPFENSLDITYYAQPGRYQFRMTDMSGRESLR